MMHLKTRKENDVDSNILDSIEAKRRFNLWSRLWCVAFPHVANFSEWEIDIPAFWTLPVIITCPIYKHIFANILIISTYISLEVKIFMNSSMLYLHDNCNWSKFEGRSISYLQFSSDAYLLDKIPASAPAHKFDPAYQTHINIISWEKKSFTFQVRLKERVR